MKNRLLDLAWIHQVESIQVDIGDSVLEELVAKGEVLDIIEIRLQILENVVKDQIRELLNETLTWLLLLQSS